MKALEEPEFLNIGAFVEGGAQADVSCNDIVGGASSSFISIRVLQLAYVSNDKGEALITYEDLWKRLSVPNSLLWPKALVW